MTRWIPPLMIAAACALSAMLLPQLPENVMWDLSSWLPPGISTVPEPLPRAGLLFGLPVLAFFMWLVMHEGPVGPLGRLGSAMFRPFTRKPSLTREDYEKFAPTYRVFVIWVVSLVLGMHLSLLSAVLDWPVSPGLIIGVAWGVGLMVVGNVMPRLRPNPIAGVRTIRTMRDPREWARVHRILGALWMIGGVVVLVTGFAAPRYALVTAISGMVLSALGGLAATWVAPHEKVPET